MTTNDQPSDSTTQLPAADQPTPLITPSASSGSSLSAFFTGAYRLAMVGLLGYIALVLRFPTTENVTRQVEVTNFPSTQKVSVLGSVSMNNFPRMLDVRVLDSMVNQDVRVTNWPSR